MAAIPIPAPNGDFGGEDERLRKALAIPTGAEVRPMAMSNRGIPVTPQTPHGIIPTNRATGQPEELNDKGKAIAPGVAGLWTRAENIHNPILRTLGKIGAVGARAIDVAGSVAAPGLFANIPGTTLNQKVGENRALKQQTADEESQQRQAATEHEQAETGAIPAKTRLENAQADALDNKPDKAEKPEDLNQQYADAVTDAVKRGVSPLEDPTVQKFGDAIQNLQKQPSSQQEALDKQYNDAIKSGDHEGAQRILKVKHDLAVAGQAPQRPPQINMIVPGANGEQTLQTLHPGQNVPTGSRTPTQFGPTAQERNVSAQAQIAAEGIPGVVSEIDRLKDQLGPVEGRWNEFMQGHVGMENSDLAGLRADLLMVSSAVALAHARGRLPENLREEFDHAINSPQQSPENLKAVLNHILPWMQRMQNMTDTAGRPQTSQGGGDSLSVKAPNGKTYVFKDKGSADSFRKAAGIE